MRVRKRPICRKEHALYGVWSGMKQRCRKLERYRGRGIIVCTLWLNDYPAFKEWCLSNGWQKGLQLDREDNEGNYCPENCRFVTAAVNSANKQKGKSGYTGIYERLGTNPWKVTVTHDGRSAYLGSYGTCEHAIQVRNSYIIEKGLSHLLQKFKGGMDQRAG